VDKGSYSDSGAKKKNIDPLVISEAVDYVNAGGSIGSAAKMFGIPENSMYRHLKISKLKHSRSDNTKLKHNPETIMKAIKSIKSGMSTVAAGKMFGIPRSTLAQYRKEHIEGKKMKFRPCPKSLHDPDLINEALNYIKIGHSQKIASKKFKIPQTTLFRHWKAQKQQQQKQPTQPKQQQQQQLNKQCSYNPDTLKQALEYIKSGSSIANAGRVFNISRKSLGKQFADYKLQFNASPVINKDPEENPFTAFGWGLQEAQKQKEETRRKKEEEQIQREDWLQAQRLSEELDIEDEEESPSDPNKRKRKKKRFDGFFCNPC